ncbi:hypothetical protein [Leptospira stimsonii]|nr:hypothetical protein [Leptospira stimsonii]
MNIFSLRISTKPNGLGRMAVVFNIFTNDQLSRLMKADLSR